MTTATSFRTRRPPEGMTPFLDRIVSATFKKVAADPACRKAKEDMEAFFADNPGRTLHLRPACEAEFGLFLDWPSPDQGRFIFTRRFSASFQMQWAIIVPAPIPDELFTEDGLLTVWRIAIPEDQRAQARQLAAKERRVASAAKNRRSIRR